MTTTRSRAAGRNAYHDRIVLLSVPRPFARTRRRWRGFKRQTRELTRALFLITAGCLTTYLILKGMM